MFKGRKPTKEEKAWLDKVSDLGCIVCLTFHSVYSPAEPHHIDGKTKPGAHLKTIGLCPRHHRHKSNDGQWVSRHGDGRKAFESRYGTEQDILDACKEIAL